MDWSSIQKQVKKGKMLEAKHDTKNNIIEDMLAEEDLNTSRRRRSFEQQLFNSLEPPRHRRRLN